ncbi:hypothetical protein GCK32_009681 [Trichostrongylus colubriformis]|uniref:Uncharacterized protein n=1 Tax=Trichostrongylus colubriformis TaxID=6319 RepID=A0AAN8J268_TRICO
MREIRKEGSATSVQRTMFLWKIIILTILLFNCFVALARRRNHSHRTHGRYRGRPWIHNYYGITKDPDDVTGTT